jgi:diadenylate cyclase
LDTLVNYLHRVSTYNPITVAVELLLIGLVVYWVVSFLEGTRGERLFHGIILLLVAGSLLLDIAAQRLHFERLEYLYKYFLIAVLFIALVGFQPEIRRALTRIGQTPTFGSSAHQLAKTIDAIVRAVEQMSQSRTGAIIVIEHQVGLGEFIESGIRLDSAISGEILKTIFHPGTPLHDMAVVIRGDRIVAARVQLPLAEADTQDGMELGSRHRAAVGITSGSDATCIVVSEETGIVSLALRGKLTRDISQDQLRSHLAEAMGGERIFKNRKKPPLEKEQQMSGER